jgi:LPXTG-motif cell wall-anchored protein
MSRKTLSTIATLAAVLATAVIPATSAAQGSVDLRSPDAREAATVVATSNGQDLRSPDAREAAAVVATSTGQDLRSPDARDTSRPDSAPAPSPAPSTGTDWGEIGLIGGAIVVTLIGVGGLLYLVRRRNTVRESGATVASS